MTSILSRTPANLAGNRVWTGGARWWQGCVEETLNHAAEELGAMGPAQLEELLASLSGAARQIAGRKRWAGANPLGTGSGIEEFVGAVLESVLAERRPWSRSDGHSLRQHLFKCLESEINNRASHKENTTREDCADDVEFAEEGCSPEQALATRQWVLRLQDGLVEAAAEDPVLQQIADLWLDGYDKPADIAEQLAMPVEQVNIALRKFRRRLQSAEVRQRVEGRYET